MHYIDFVVLNNLLTARSLKFIVNELMLVLIKLILLENTMKSEIQQGLNNHFFSFKFKKHGKFSNFKCLHTHESRPHLCSIAGF